MHASRSAASGASFSAAETAPSSVRPAGQQARGPEAAPAGAGRPPSAAIAGVASSLVGVASLAIAGIVALACLR